MKKNEYIEEVGSLRLSEEFKEALKAKMLEEYNSREESEPEITVSGPVRFSKKYAKYAAVAAAFLIVASTAGILAIKNIPSKSDNATAEASPETVEDTVEVGDAQSNQNADSAEAPALYNIDGGAKDDLSEETYDVPDEDLPDEEADIEVSESDGAEEDIPPADTVPATNYDPEENTKYSKNASENYDGDYNGDDYINTDTGSPDGLSPTTVESVLYAFRSAVPYENNTPENAPVAQNIDETEAPEAVAEKESPSAQGNTENEAAPTTGTGENELPLPSQGSESSGIGPTESPETPVGAPVEVPVDAPEITEDEDVEEVDYVEEVDEAINVDEEAEILEAEILEEASDEPETEVMAVEPAAEKPEPYADYYSYRDLCIGEGSEMGLIRFRIEKAYDVSELTSAASGIMMDQNSETLYKIKISYDYLNSESVSETRLMLGLGTNMRALDGQPVLSGEYIARVTENGDGTLTADSCLIYKIYNVGGIDLAYHVVSPLGNNIDPGDTNMGLAPEESSVYTTSSNNPEKYAQKAAVNELTRYLKRNLAKINVRAIDLSHGLDAPRDSVSASYSAGSLKAAVVGSEITYPDRDGGVKALLEAMGAEIGEKTCSVITKDGSKAHFKDGELTGIDSASGAAPLGLSVNGVFVGLEKEAALELLKISGVKLEDDAVITLRAAEEDGGWTAEISLAGGVVSKIKVR